MSNFLSHKAAQAKCFHPTGKFIEFRKEDVEQSIPGLFEKRIGKYLNRVAIKTLDREMTYDELNKKANVLAGILLDHSSKGEDSIALMFGKGTEIVVSIFGVLKTGKIYVPLDPAYPVARLSYMLSDSQAKLIITNSQHLSLAQELSQEDTKIINLDDINFNTYDGNPGINIPPETLANIIYTSGSSGKPKGVLQNHLTLLYEARCHTNQFHICDEDRMEHLHSESFSAAVRRIFPSLLNGAALYPLDIGKADSPNLIEWMRDEGITIGSGRHLLACMNESKKYEKLPDVRLVSIGSDVVRKKDIEDCRKILPPDCIIVVNLATTETASDRQYFIDMDTEITTSALPVGYEVEGKKILILDDERQEVAVDCVGEIAVKSAYLSPGYWQRPDLTRAKYLPDPDGGDERIYLTGDLGRILPDGCLVHLGRKDFQVKIRGYRVEIPEVENALLNIDGIKEAVVVAREYDTDDKRLVAYVARSEEANLNASMLRRALLEKLPDYMIPSAFVILGALPHTPNGKVDRLSLPEPEKTRPELETPFIPPQTPVEEKLTGIWRDVLGIDRVGIQDNFLELGGHSLLAGRIISRVTNTFKLEIPLQILFQSPTVKDMSVVIVENQMDREEQEMVDKILSELEELPDGEA